MNKKGTIIVVDDNRGVREALRLLLGSRFERVVTLPSPAGLPAALREEGLRAVLLDMNFGAGPNTGGEGLYWLREARKLRPGVPVVLVTAYADIGLAVRGIKEGAADFVVKPWDNARLLETLDACLAAGEPERPARGGGGGGAMYWGGSEPMRRLRELTEKVARTDANILLTGENGTGKEMLAREIHALSARRTRDLVTVDMGAVSETLFESELFGHVRGAFTDARADRPGKFEAADGGTLFLDEIGNLPAHLQPKLLSVIQQRSVTRLGSNTPRPVDIRLVSATNRDLDEMTARGTFREDLLYRINTIRLHLPPLRERAEDICPLAERFAARFARQYGKDAPRLADSARERLMRHPWPGNVRELEHAVEKAVIISDGDTLAAEHFALRARRPAPAAGQPAATLEEMEARMIRQAVEQCGGNLSAVAARLGITRQTLYNKMKKHDI